MYLMVILSRCHELAPVNLSAFQPHWERNERDLFFSVLDPRGPVVLHHLNSATSDTTLTRLYTRLSRPEPHMLPVTARQDTRCSLLTYIEVTTHRPTANKKRHLRPDLYLDIIFLYISLQLAIILYLYNCTFRYISVSTNITRVQRKTTCTYHTM